MDSLVGGSSDVIVGSIAVAAAATALGAWWWCTQQQSGSEASGARVSTVARYVPFVERGVKDVSELVVTDCTHPSALTLTHHKGDNNPAGLPPSDCSTGLVLNAQRAFAASDPNRVLIRSKATSNHFDVDSFLSIWAYCNPELAAKHERLLRQAARLGDFREAFLLPKSVDSAEAAADGGADAEMAHKALQLCCWLNTVEKTKFSAPFEGKDCDEKFAYFMPRLAGVLEDLEAYEDDWIEEYEQVLTGLRTLAGPGALIKRYDDMGLVVVRAPLPVHYYALFAHTLGADYVLTMYPEQKYELECKYTQYVNVHSRPVQARLEMAPLAAALNDAEAAAKGDGDVQWACSRFVDSGPILRMDSGRKPLNKMQRYGHPFERPIHSSNISPEEMEAAVTSFLRMGLEGTEPRVGGWSWEALHEVNKVAKGRVPNWRSQLLCSH